MRITATEGMAVRGLTPVLAAFQAEHPAIRVELLVHNQLVDLLRREADIALRLGRPRQADLVARKGAELALGLYASRAYLDRAGRPGAPADPSDHCGVAFDDAMRHRGPGAWTEERLRGCRIVYRSNGVQAQRAAIRAGYGIGSQACAFADPDPELERVLPELEHTLEVWLVTHTGLRRSARIRAAFGFLAARLAEAAPALAAGRRAPGGALRPAPNS